MVRSLPANAGDMDSIPGLGRSHMPPCATTTEAHAPTVRSPEDRSHCSEKLEHLN